jgi:hypothetical protein
MRFIGMVLIIVMGFCLLQVPVSARQEKVIADRTPLSFRDAGLYSNLDFVHPGNKPKEDGVTNLLSVERAISKESPWNFYIIQHNEQRPNDASLIKRMAENGKKIILRLHIGRLDPNPDVNELEKKMVNLMDGIDPDWLYAITLGEEHVFWNGWTEALTELYYRAKKRWPDLPVYQWWTPMETPDVRAKNGWVALPADGWMSDLYGEPREVFEKKICMFLETGKPVIHTVWSTPAWPVLCGAQSWEGGGQKVFDDQLDICQAYNIPVAHFCVQYEKGSDPFRWGWHAVDQITRNWYMELEASVNNFKYMPDETIGYRTLNDKKFDWAHYNKQPMILFDLDEQNRKRVLWRSNLSGVHLASGEHTVHNTPYFGITCILDESANMLQNHFGVAGVQGKAVSVPVIFRIEPKMPLAGMVVTAHVKLDKQLGGAATLAYSLDGSKWTESIVTIIDKNEQILKATKPSHLGFSSEPFWVRVQLSCNSGVETNASVTRLESVDISALYEQSIEKIVTSGM